MTHITKHTLYRRRALRNLEDARDALALYRSCLDEAGRLTRLDEQYLNRGRDYTDDLKSDIETMLAELKEERSAA